MRLAPFGQLVARAGAWPPTRRTLTLAPTPPWDRALSCSLLNPKALHLSQPLIVRTAVMKESRVRESQVPLESLDYVQGLGDRKVPATDHARVA